MFGFLMPLVSKIVPWKDLILLGLIALVVGGGWLYIGKLQAERNYAVSEAQRAQDIAKRVMQINDDNVKAFNAFRASMDRALDEVKAAADAERQRAEDLSQFIEDLQNVQDTDACINSEPVRRALDWLRGKAGAAPPN